jgi:hypothetical protein
VGPDAAGAPLYRRRDDLESDTPHAGFIRRRKAERGAHEMRTGMTTTTQREGRKRKGRKEITLYGLAVGSARILTRFT